MINEKQARALVNLLHEIRRGWSIPSMMKLFEKNHDHPAPFPDIAVAAAAAANDDKVTSPGIIFIDTRFWPEPAKPKLPKPPACEDHPEQDAHNCRCCLADVKVGERPQEFIGKRLAHDSEPDPDGAAAVRKALREIQQAPLSKVDPLNLDNPNANQG